MSHETGRFALQAVPEAKWPLLDRIDIHIEAPRLSSEELMGKRAGESSAPEAGRADEERRPHRQRTDEGAATAPALRHGRFDQRAAQSRLNQFNLSGRGYDRILKVSRTIADLESSETIELHHVAEAINYRAFDRKLFG